MDGDGSSVSCSVAESIFDLTGLGLELGFELVVLPLASAAGAKVGAAGGGSLERFREDFEDFGFEVVRFSAGDSDPDMVAGQASFDEDGSPLVAGQSSSAESDTFDLEFENGSGFR